MSQEIKTVIRNVSPSNYAAVDQELSFFCKTGGWELHSTHYLFYDKHQDNGTHNILYIFTREVGEEGQLMTRKRGRPPMPDKELTKEELARE